MTTFLKKLIIPLIIQGSLNSLDTIIIFTDKNIKKDTFELIKKGNNLKAIIITHEENFDSFIEELNQLRKNSHFILGTYDNNINNIVADVYEKN